MVQLWCILSCNCRGTIKGQLSLGEPALSSQSGIPFVKGALDGQPVSCKPRSKIKISFFKGALSIVSYCVTSHPGSKKPFDGFYPVRILCNDCYSMVEFQWKWQNQRWAATSKFYTKYKYSTGANFIFYFVSLYQIIIWLHSLSNLFNCRQYVLKKPISVLQSPLYMNLFWEGKNCFSTAANKF